MLYCIEGLCKIEEYNCCNLAIVNVGQPLINDVYQGCLCRSFLAETVLRGVQKVVVHQVFVELTKFYSAVSSIGFEVDILTGKVGGSLLFEHQRRELPRGVWGHAPSENFEI